MSIIESITKDLSAEKATNSNFLKFCDSVDKLNLPLGDVLRIQQAAYILSLETHSDAFDEFKKIMNLSTKLCK
jgi:hypothetical protein